MTLLIDRRKFFGNSILASSAVMASSAYGAFLQNPEAEAKVFAILQKQLKLGENQRALVAAFTRSLRSNDIHHQSPDDFKRALGEGAAREDLENYVVQEFIVSTNYLAYAGGHAKSLALVTARAESQKQLESFR